MPDLDPLTPFAGLDTSHGTARLCEVPPALLRWLAPYPGREDAFSAALAEAVGAGLPPPGTALRAGEVDLRWAGRAQALLIGEATLPDALLELGAVTDVSDVHGRLALTGADTPAVLARLSPLDLRPSAFAPGQTARSLLGHMPAQFTAIADGVEVTVMASFAQSAAHEIEVAMQSVAARAMLH